MQNIKQFNKGDLIFKEGESIDKVCFIQSGRVSLFIERNQKRIEIEQLSSSQVLGELGALSNGKHGFSACALAPTKILEVPTEILAPQLEKTAPVIKLLLKSTIEGVKQIRQKMKGIKMEQEEISCPQVLIPKLFAMYPILARHLGKVNEESQEYKVSWQALKTYTTRMFLESPQRVQSGLELLKKLGYVDIHTALDENEEEVISDIIFREVQTIEDFAEFYQYHLYKPGRAEILYLDEVAFKIVKVVAGMAYPHSPDHRDSVSLDYDKVLEEVKKKAGVDIKNTHWDLLEKKGLYVQRKSREQGLTLQLNKDEFIKTAIFWAFIKEIESWNQKGFIDFTQEKQVASVSTLGCPDCSTPITAEQKFCQNCGAKLLAA